MSLVVYAGASQFSAVGVLLAGGGPVAAAATGLLLNTRTAAFSLAVADTIGRGRLARLVGAHLVADETVGLRPRPAGPGPAPGRLLDLRRRPVRRMERDRPRRRPRGQRAGRHGHLRPGRRLPRRTRRSALLGTVLALAVTPAVPAGVPVLVALAGLALYGRRNSANVRERSAT
ncbi:putative branched-subunit amino acid permease [Streptomyces sp. V4I2]|nr:putative branched-subunit amino acid permease [Streptomyces sp. V4I2]